MSTYFISDLHLDPRRPASSRALLKLLAGLRSAETLYILGDFVEYWLGDDDDAHQLDDVFEGIRKLSIAGVPVYFMHGNRDFLISTHFLKQYGMQLLQDPVVVDLYGEKTLLTHGDLLCTDDLDYQNFRSMVRNPQWQSEFLAKPVAERRAIVTALRQTSKQAMQDKAEHIMDVSQPTVERTMLEHKVYRLVHGHTHRPGVHTFRIDGKKYERIVLGDWYQGTSILELEPGGYRLLELSQLT